jgi:2-dehydro-3-deoxyphosphogluconate aldolase/(4S)-4-hydroxy-2-oxoglutarate aldolase
MTVPETVSQLAQVGVIAVLRAPDWHTCVHAAEALVAGGVLGIEVTYSTPEAHRAITALANSLPAEAVLGAGTVTTPKQAREAVDSGARFLVSPGTTPPLAEALKDTGATCLMGAFTPSEVLSVLSWGADIVKLFPASQAGPGYLRALRGPFPDVPFMPTGGITPENIAEWKRAGVAAVGAGGELCPRTALDSGEWSHLTDGAKQFTRAWKEA